MILIIDEAHELLRHDAGKIGKSMVLLLTCMLNEGVFSIVLLGTEEFLQLLDISSELKNRCVPDEDVTMNACDIRKAEDRIYFFTFLKRLEDQIFKAGVVDRPLGWVDSLEDRAKLHNMSQGIPGVACRILRLALECAFRAERKWLEWNDVEAAFRAFNRNHKKPGFDPFANGPQRETLARLKSRGRFRCCPA